MRSLHGLMEKRPGLYYTRDGRFRVERHQSSGRAVGGLGYNAWHIFKRRDEDDSEGHARCGAG